MPHATVYSCHTMVHLLIPEDILYCFRFPTIHFRGKAAQAVAGTQDGGSDD
jgi:hypothetical protein